MYIYLNAKVKNAMQISSYLSVILRLTSPVLCLAYNIKIRMLLLMVAEKTPKLQVGPFFKIHRGAIPCIVCENKISNQCLFSKARKTTKANLENVCIGRRLLRLCDVFKF